MFVGATTRAESAVVVVDLPPHGEVTLAVVRGPRDVGLDPGWIAEPRSIEVPTADGGTTHALHYRPTHPSAVGPPGAAPPLLVLSHGGPTSAARPAAAAWPCSSGRRGASPWSTSTTGAAPATAGPTARPSPARWGVVDVDDCIAVARHLVAEGEADGDRLAIRGGSAGGYTTLCALAFRDDFSAGTSLYGVADLEALARDTHKFESRYLDSLVGPYPGRRATSTSSARPSTTSRASPARCSCCRASRTRSSRRPSPR